MIIAQRVCVGWRTAGSGLVCGGVCFQISSEEKDLAVMQASLLRFADSDGYFISRRDRTCLFA